MTFTHGFDGLVVVESDVGFAGINQGRGNLVVTSTALRLTIRAEWPLFTRALVEREAGPSQHTQNILLSSLHETRPVGVFDTKNKRTALLTSQQIVVKGRSQTSDVKKSCGTWGKTDAHESVSR